MLRSGSFSNLTLKQPKKQRWTCPAWLSSKRLGLVWATIVLWLLYLAYTRQRAPPLAPPALPSKASLLATAIYKRVSVLDLGRDGPEALRVAIKRAVQPDSFAAHAREIRNAQGDKYETLLAETRALLADLATASEVVECSWDASLSLDGLYASKERVLLAANMRDNEELMPHFLLQTLHTLALLPQDQAFLSIYESGSGDSTGGSLTREPEQDRIDFLAQVRNLALEPLWRKVAGQEVHLDLSGSKKSAILSLKTGSAPTPMWPAERMVFLNDVYFCAKDVVRLLLHDADMACGMDFDRPKLGEAPKQEQRQEFAQELHRRRKVPVWLGKVLGLWSLVLRRFSESDEANERWRERQPLGFYDTWVARDSDGNLFLKKPPYVTDPYSLQRVKAGLPFPVKCCWNGLVVLKSAPFLHNGVRVRMHKEGECAASECSLVCNDLLRLNYTRLVVDPGVRQAYVPKDARQLYSDRWARLTVAMVQNMTLTTWGNVEAAAPIAWDMVPLRPYYQCCGLKPGHNMIEFDKDCQWDNFLSPNYTAMPEPAANLTGRSQNQTQTARLLVQTTAHSRRMPIWGRFQQPLA